MVDFNPDRDILDLSGKIILLTGGNVGLRRETIYQLSKHKPACLYLAARSKSKAEKTINDIARRAPRHAPVLFLELNLTPFESIKSAVKSFLASNDRLDILINKASIMACPAGLSKEGYVIQFGTNHVVHALLTKLLLPVLQKTAKIQPTSSVPIANISGGAESFAPIPAGIELDKLKDASCDGMGNMNTYLKSGPIKSYGSWLSPFLKTIAWAFWTKVSKGAYGQLWANATPSGIKTGTFYFPVGVTGKDSQLARDQSLTDISWRWTENELKFHEL